MLVSLALILALNEPNNPCLLTAEGADGAAIDRMIAVSGTGLHIAGHAFLSSDIKRAVAGFSEYTNAPMVTLIFTPSGHAKFRRLQRGMIGMALPIVIDRKVLSCPRLMEEVEGDRVQISGLFTAKEAKQLAHRLSRQH